MRRRLPKLFLASIPLLALCLVVALVLVFDWSLYAAGSPTISDCVRDLYATYGVIVPIVMVGFWFGFVGLATGALVIHFFLNKY